MLISAEADLRSDQRTLVDAVATMLPSGEDRVSPPPLPLTSDSAVTILRGFDRRSRATRDALRSILVPHGVAVHDLAPAPPLGSIPTARQTDLVIATGPALRTAALRCATMWGAAVLSAEHDLPTHAVPQLTARDMPVASVTTPRGGTEVITRALRINAPVTCLLPKGAPRPSEGVLIEPSIAGLHLTLDLDTDHPQTRAVTAPITLSLRHDTPGHLDDAPMPLHRGQTHISTAMHNPARIIVSARQDPS